MNGPRPALDRIRHGRGTSGGQRGLKGLERGICRRTNLKLAHHARPRAGRMPTRNQLLPRRLGLRWRPLAIGLPDPGCAEAPFGQRPRSQVRPQNISRFMASSSTRPIRKRWDAFQPAYRPLDDRYGGDRCKLKQCHPLRVMRISAFCLTLFMSDCNASARPTRYSHSISLPAKERRCRLESRKPSVSSAIGLRGLGNRVFRRSASGVLAMLTGPLFFAPSRLRQAT